MSTDEFTLYDAAYVLGALSPVERREFEAHLKDCAACSIAVSELAGLPGLMSKVPVEQLTAEVEAPPETLLPSLARAVRRERGRRRLAVGAAGVAAAALIGVGAAVLTEPDSPARPPLASPTSAPSGSASLVMTAVVPSPVSASARLVDMAWGTRIDLTCAYNTKGYSSAAGSSYALVVIDRSGAAQQVATWKALPDREVNLMGASSLTRQNIAVVEIRTMSGRALLRLST
ncbi:MAG: zf-HC2 domain-containing protein [Dermatophilaceae bacterium]